MQAVAVPDVQPVPVEPQMSKEQLGEVTGIAVTEKDLFVVTRQKKGYGFCVWRSGS